MKKLAVYISRQDAEAAYFKANRAYKKAMQAVEDCRAFAADVKTERAYAAILEYEADAAVLKAAQEAAWDVWCNTH